MVNSKIFIWMTASCILFSCGSNPKDKHQNEDEHQHEHEQEVARSEHHHDDAKGVKDIEFDASKFSSSLFAVEQVVRRNFSPVIRVGGQLLPIPNGTEHLVAPSTGIVRLIGAALYPGANLQKGQDIAFVSSAGLGEGDAQAKAAASLKKTQAEYERASMLVKDQLVSQREYEQAQLDYDNAKIAYQIWNKQTQGIGISVPKASYLEKLYVHNGDYVQAGQLIATLSRKDRLSLQANVPQRYADRVKSVKSANFVLAGQKQVYSLEQKQGKLVSIGQTYAENGTIPVNFELNGTELVSGSMVEVFLKLAEPTKLIAIPIDAVTEEQGAFYVYVHEQGHTYNKRSVDLGETDGQRIHIRSGIEEGEIVVVKGSYLVKMAGATGAIPHGHTH